MTVAGFEPAPSRTAALTQRLRPLGHTIALSAELTQLRLLNDGSHSQYIYTNLKRAATIVLLCPAAMAFVEAGGRAPGRQLGSAHAKCRRIATA